MLNKISIKDLLDAGVHFGHPTRRWNPKMKPYIHSARNGIYIVDLTQTMRQLQKACQYLYDQALQGSEILFVGTKRQAQDIVRTAAEGCNQHYMCERWLGGTLTNHQTIRKSIARMQGISKMEESGELAERPKKEAASLKREHGKLYKNLAGIVDLRRMPDVLVVVDVERESNAVHEATRLGIPVVAIVDTNCNPDQVDYPIPGNDDAVRSIQLIIDTLAQAVKAGREINRRSRQAEEPAAADKGVEADDDKAAAVAGEAAKA